MISRNTESSRGKALLKTRKAKARLKFVDFMYVWQRFVVFSVEINYTSPMTEVDKNVKTNTGNPNTLIVCGTIVIVATLVNNVINIVI